MRNWEITANRTLARQEQVITMAQALACGATRGSVSAKVRSKAWTPVAKGVYRRTGTERGWLQAVWIGHLAAGAESVVSHEAAAQLLGLDRVRRGLVTLTVPPGRTPAATGARYTRSSHLPAAHLMTAQGLPVTTPGRTIVDLAARRDLSAKHIEDVMVAAHRARQCSIAQVAAIAGELHRSGRPGAVKLRTVLRAYGDGQPAPDSELEVHLWKVIHLAGLPEAGVGQHPLPEGPLIGCVDAAFPIVKLIVEADGFRWHSLPEDTERDRQRDIQASARGWLTVRLTYRQLVHEAGPTAARLRATYQQRLLQFGRGGAA